MSPRVHIDASLSVIELNGDHDRRRRFSMRSDNVIVLLRLMDVGFHKSRRSDPIGDNGLRSGRNERAKRE